MTEAAGPIAVNTRSTAGWREAFIALGLAVGVLLLAFWPTFASIVLTWMNSATYTHGFLIVPIVGYLIWLRRGELSHLQPTPSYWGLASVFGLSLFWLVGYAVDVMFVEQLAAVCLIPAFVWALLGLTIVRAMAFPLAFLLFAVPAGDFLVPILQDYTATFSVKALQLSNIPVFREGRYISIPAGDFEVARACSGVRYLIASVSLGCLYAYLSYRSRWRQLLFLVLAAIIPIIANGIRAYGIIMIGHLSDMKLAAGVDHIIYGWVFFGVVMALLFWVGSLFREREPSVKKTDGHVSEATKVSAMGNKAFVSQSTAVLLMMALGPASALLLAQDANGAREVVLQAPDGQGGWRGPTVPPDNWKPVFHGSRQELFKAYEKQGATVYLYIAYYPNQRQGSEVINSQNRLYDGELWRRIREASKTVALPDGVHWQVHSTELAYYDTQRITWHWFDIAGHVTVQPLRAKWLEAKARLFGDQRGAMATVIATDYDIDTAEAEARLEDFMRTMLPVIQATATPRENQ